MPARVPRKKQINTAFTTVLKEIRQANQEINSQAATLVQKGRHEKAQQLIELSKATQAYLEEVRAVKKRLNQLSGGGGGGKAKSQEPARKMWEYYAPILQSLVDIGGEGWRKDIEEKFGASYGDWLLPGDHTQLTHGLKWQIMIRRAKKHLAQEGWIELPNSKLWRITASGRKAAKNKQA